MVHVAVGLASCPSDFLRGYWREALQSSVSFLCFWCSSVHRGTWTWPEGVVLGWKQASSWLSSN